MRIYLLIFLLTWTSWVTTSGTRGHQVIGSSQPVMAMVGDDVILPCHIEPPVNMENETVVWRRSDRWSPYYVHHLLDGRVDSEHQNPSYKQRTSLFPEQLSHGNISLKLTRVKLSDQGTYMCIVPHLGQRYSEIQLLVGHQVIGSSQPVMAMVGDDVILPCHIEPPVNMEKRTVEWRRSDLWSSGYVHRLLDGRVKSNHQISSYKQRTSLFPEQLSHGNISLKLTRVELSDQGEYSCHVPHLDQRYSYIQLRIGHQVIGSSQPVMAMVGDDVILPCHIEPPVNMEKRTVEWRRSVLWSSGYVHRLLDGRVDSNHQISSYKQRTSLFPEQLSHGNISLKLTRVKLSDQGEYSCHVPHLYQRYSYIQLRIGHQVIGSSQPVMAMVGDDVILPCHIEPPVNMEKRTMEWRILGSSDYVHRLLDGRVNSEDQNPSYKQRTSLFPEQLSHGNISLKLTRVKLSDQGTYSCSVPHLDQRSSEIQLRLGHQVIGSSQPVMAMVGDDVILPCHIEPPVNMENETMEWRILGSSDYVHRLLDGRVNSEDQIPSYKQRTSLFPEQLSHGNISLKLTRVKLSDQGTYRCSVPHLDQRYSEIQLLLGSVSQPVISLTVIKGDLLSWRCDSGCWFPKPQVSWLNRDGNTITAEPSVTEKPSDHCYVVQRNVTVALTERVTCRVHLAHINHTVETHSVKPESVSLATGVIAGIVLTVIIIVVTAILGYFFWKKRKQTSYLRRSQEESGEQEQLRDASIPSPSPEPREILHIGERWLLEQLANTDDSDVTKVTSPIPQEWRPVSIRWRREESPNTDDTDVTKGTSPKLRECSPQLEKLPNAVDCKVTKVTSPKPQEWSPQLEKLPNTDDSDVNKITSPKLRECSPQLEKLPNADDRKVTKVTSPKPQEWIPVSKRWRPEKLPNTDDTEVTKVTSPKPQERLPTGERWRPQLEKLANADDRESTKVTLPKLRECSPQLEKLPNAVDCKVTKVTSPKLRKWSPQLEKHPNTDDCEVTKVTSPKLREWSPVSKKWRPQLEKLANSDHCNVTKVGSLVFGKDEEFCIAKGSDGNEVFLGLREDGTEVAVKRMTQFNHHALKKEKNLLGLLDDPSIVRYVDFIEDKNFVYLVLQLCEYTLKEYITEHNISELIRKQLANQFLKGLSILHCHNPTILHRDIKPQNVLIDIQGKARLADFGISRLLPEGQTTLVTSAAGTKYWRAKETLDAGIDISYKRSSDIQVAGMLIYYILSRGHHPFGEGARCETNILDGNYNLDHIQDVIAKDLIERMINKDPKKRPTVEECLLHPFFWLNERKVDYLRRIGNLKEVQNCQNADKDLIRRLDQHAEQGQFNTWKDNFPPELLQKLDGKKKSYPENSFGLLRFIHNLHEHYAEDEDEAQIELLEMFPDLFGGLHKFAKEQEWNSRPSLKDMFTTANPERNTRLSLPVQESGPSDS